MAAVLGNGLEGGGFSTFSFQRGSTSAMQPWVGYLTSPHLSSLIYKMGEKLDPLPGDSGELNHVRM